MAKVVDQNIPEAIYQDLYKVAHPANQTAERRFGMFKFNYTKFGSTRDPEYVRQRYPWRLPHMQGL